MVENLKRFTLSFLTVVFVLSISVPLTSNAKNTNNFKTVLTEENHKIGFGVPEVKSDSLFRNTSKNVEFNTQKKGDSILQTITIHPASSNITIKIPLEFQNGEYLMLGEDELGNSDGAAMIYNEEHESIGILSSPVLGNEENLNVVSVTKKDDNTLEYNLESDGLSEPTTMLVTLTATSYSSYFSSGKWITRDGLISLSLTHKPYLLSGSTNDRMFKQADSWNKVVAKHRSNSRWRNQNSLYNQYICHYGYVTYKNPWNLEPSRPDVGLVKTIAKRCNP